VGAAVGTGPEAIERAQAVIQAGADALFIDAATGHTIRVLDLIGERWHFRGAGFPVVAGNVVTREGARDLDRCRRGCHQSWGGSGFDCTTRIIAGVGAPQLSAILNVAAEARPRGVPVIADGGIRYSWRHRQGSRRWCGCGHAGVDSRRDGGESWGHGSIPGRTFKEYRGMGSLKAMRRGSSDRYGQNASGKMVAEGVEARVPYRGRLEDVIFQLLGGLRSGMGYIGAANLDELRANARFVRITPGGLRESHPHDITITEEPVNYQSMKL